MILFSFDRIFPAVVLGFILDLLIGDPAWLYHPVRLIGKLIDISEAFWRRRFSKDKKGERIAGVCCALTVILVTMLVTGGLLFCAYRINFWLGFALETFWCWQLLAVKSLRTESMKVHHALTTGSLDDARYAVSMIVGRDTERLDETGVTKACVETIAESTSDGIGAPLLFMLIGGALGGFFYKSINTMDSMIGYKNDKYQYFGTFAAKLDDVVNFIPARIAGLLMVLASLMSGFDAKNSWRIFLRDRKKHASPNSAHTEAAMAGALNIQLAGDAYYFGKLKKKQTLGDPNRPIRPDDIIHANNLTLTTAVLALLFGVLIRIVVLVIF